MPIHEVIEMAQSHSFLIFCCCEHGNLQIKHAIPCSTECIHHITAEPELVVNIIDGPDLPADCNAEVTLAKLLKHQIEDETD